MRIIQEDVKALANCRPANIINIIPHPQSLKQLPEPHSVIDVTTQSSENSEPIKLNGIKAQKIIT